MATMFIHNFDVLVTRDFLDSRFSEFEARMDLRFAAMETRFARVNVLLGVILVSVTIPVLQTVLLWLK